MRRLSASKRYSNQSNSKIHRLHNSIYRSQRRADRVRQRKKEKEQENKKTSHNKGIHRGDLTYEISIGFDQVNQNY